MEVHTQPLVSRCRQWHTDVSTMIFTVRFNFPMYYNYFPFPHPSFFGGYSSWWAVVSSPNQIFHTHPVASLKNRVWACSLGRLGPNYKVFWHVVTPIRFVREVNYV